MTVVLPSLDVALVHLDRPTISPADFAALAEMSVDVVYDAIHRDEIPVVRAGARFRIPNAWVRQQLRLADPTSTA